MSPEFFTRPQSGHHHRYRRRWRCSPQDDPFLQGTATVAAPPTMLLRGIIVAATMMILSPQYPASCVVGLVTATTTAAASTTRRNLPHQGTAVRNDSGRRDRRFLEAVDAVTIRDSRQRRRRSSSSNSNNNNNSNSTSTSTSTSTSNNNNSRTRRRRRQQLEDEFSSHSLEAIRSIVRPRNNQNKYTNTTPNSTTTTATTTTTWTEAHNTTENSTNSMGGGGLLRAPPAEEEDEYYHTKVRENNNGELASYLDMRIQQDPIEDPTNTTTQPLLPRLDHNNNKLDDDYSVVFLDDAVPWTDDVATNDDEDDAAGDGAVNEVDIDETILLEEALIEATDEQENEETVPIFEDAMIFEEAAIEEEEGEETEAEDEDEVVLLLEPTLAPTKTLIENVVFILNDDIPWDDVVAAPIIEELASNMTEALELELELELEMELSEKEKDTADADEEDTIIDADADNTSDTVVQGSGNLPSSLPTISHKPTTTQIPTWPPSQPPVVVVVVVPTRSPQPIEMAITLAPTLVPRNDNDDGYYPSMMPTTTFSSTTRKGSPPPSASPTRWCQDDPGYQSPINQLTCESHRATNCLAWRFLGLTLTELEDLVTGCPQTCNIECDAFALYETPVSFRMQHVRGFLDTTDVEVLSEFMSDYLEDYIREYVGSAGASSSSRSGSASSSSPVSFSSSFPVASRPKPDNNNNNNNNNNNDHDNDTMDGDDDGEEDTHHNDDDSWEYKVEQDDFLNDDIVMGNNNIIVFEIESVILTSQTLVEEFDDDENDVEEEDVIDDNEGEEETYELSVVTSRLEDTDNNNNKSRVRLLLRRGLQQQYQEEDVSNEPRDIVFSQKMKERDESSSSSSLLGRSDHNSDNIVETDQALEIVMTFEGFTIGMKTESIPALIVKGIDSPGFTLGLRRTSSDFFMHATVSSAMETPDVSSEDRFDDNEEAGQIKNSKFATIISIIVPIVVIVLIVWSFVCLRYYRKKKNWNSLVHHHRRSNKNRLSMNHRHHNYHEYDHDGTQIGNGRSATPLAAAMTSGVGIVPTAVVYNNGMYFDDLNEDGVNSVIEDLEINKDVTTMPSPIKECDNETEDDISDKNEGERESNATGGNTGSRIERFLTALSLNISASKTSDPDTEESKDEEEFMHEDIVNSGYLPENKSTDNTNNEDDGRRQQIENSNINNENHHDHLKRDDGERRNRKSLAVINDGLLRDTLLSPMSDGSDIDSSILKNNRTIPAIADIDNDGYDDNDEFNNSYETILPPMIIIDNIDVGNDEIDATNPSSSITSANKKPTSTVVRGGTPLKPSSQEQADALDKFASEFRDHLVRQTSQATEARSINTSRSSIITDNDKHDNSRSMSFRGSFYDAYSNTTYEMTPQKGVFGPMQKISTQNDENGLVAVSNSKNERKDTRHSRHQSDTDVIRHLVSTLSEDHDEDLVCASINEKRVGSITSLEGTPRLRKKSASFSESTRSGSPTPSPKKKPQYGTWDGISPSTPTATVEALAASLPGTIVGDFNNTNFDPSSTPLSEMMMMRGRNPQLRSRSRGSLPPKRPPTPERVGNIITSNISHRKTNSGNSCSPISNHSRKSVFSVTSPFSRAFAIGGTNSVDSDGVHLRHKRDSSDDTDELRVVGNGSNLSAITFTDESMNKSQGINENSRHSNRVELVAEPVRLEFDAPRKGNWGLVLESTTKTGPTVYAVKDYSPLFGLIQKGDKLLEIDGKNVSQCELSDVTKLLKGKSSSSVFYQNPSTSMPIIILRQNTSAPSSFGSSSKRQHQQARRSESSHEVAHHQRNSSNGSADSESSRTLRIVEDMDEHIDDVDDFDLYTEHQKQYKTHTGSNEI